MKRLALAALLTLALAQAGCLEDMDSDGGARSLSGVYGEVERPTSPLGMYSNVEVGRIENAFNGPTPSGLIEGLPDAILASLKAGGLPTGARGPTLTIDACIIYYEQAGTAGAFSGFEEVVAEVTLREGKGGDVVARSFCVGRSTTVLDKGVTKKTRKLADSIAAWIASHYPRKPDQPES